MLNLSFALFRYDRNRHGGEILLFVREDIPVKMSSTTSANNFEGFLLELNIRKKKILLCCSYYTDKSNISSHLTSLGEILDIQMTKYDNFIIVGDFDSEF